MYLHQMKRPGLIFGDTTKELKEVVGEIPLRRYKIDPSLFMEKNNLKSIEDVNIVFIKRTNQGYEEE